ncbi:MULTISPECIES: GNAT family N-acetyltransferase [Kitasatospora]|uniref:GNAT family N-acetyltransferase n=1 Tax=Kitasatospora cystarginea TaxID=58350 RepID=A0ABN3E923_9ACTN
MIIRLARIDDLPLLQDIERAAGEPFHSVGMPEIAEDEPPSIEELARYQRAGLAWVSADADDHPVAYLIAEPVDGNLHVEQVSVHPEHGRRGIGRELLEHLAGHAAAHRMPALTLTTFLRVPWNAPYYERCGFRTMDPATLPPGLREIRRLEAEHGLDHWPRVCMIRPLRLP